MDKWDRSDEPDIRNHYGALWDKVSLTHIIVGRKMRQVVWYNWVPAEDLLHSGVDIGQIIPVGEGGKPAVSDDTINLLLGLSLSLRVQRHGEEEGCHDGHCLC